MRTVKLPWLAALIALAGTTATEAVSYVQVSNNAGQDISAQLDTILTDAGSGRVNFKFLNNVGIASSVKEIYFQDTVGLLSDIELGTQNGANFAVGSANPGDLPGGNSISPVFSVSAGLLADAGNGGPATGLNAAADFVNINFLGNFADVLQALNAGSIRLGLHVISIGTSGESDAYVTTGTPSTNVPDGGATAVLLGLGVLGLTLARKRS